MIAKIQPFCMYGDLKVIPSKSVSHRALICAALADGESELRNIAFSEDITATATALCALGFCRITVQENRCTVTGQAHGSREKVIDCGESGSTLRFLIPPLLTGEPVELVGRGRLMQRPLSGFDSVFAKDGIRAEKTLNTLSLDGTLKGGKYSVTGNVSSQFTSGLLFALPLLKSDSVIRFTTEVESRPYIELTRAVQRDFGVQSAWSGNEIAIPGGQTYRPHDMTVEGDYSHAAFFAAGAAMSGEITLRGLERNSLQGDREILRIIEDMGADVHWEDKDVRIKKADKLRPFEADVREIPDLVPILAVLGCAAAGTTKILNAARLRLKESDRLSATANELNRLGACVEEREDSLIIRGNGRLAGGNADSCNDHRIAMAIGTAACIADRDIILHNAQAVAKSAPLFFEELAQAGGTIS